MERRKWTIYTPRIKPKPPFVYLRTVQLYQWHRYCIIIGLGSAVNERAVIDDSIRLFLSIYFYNFCEKYCEVKRKNSLFFCFLAFLLDLAVVSCFDNSVCRFYGLLFSIHWEIFSSVQWGFNDRSCFRSLPLDKNRPKKLCCYPLTISSGLKLSRYF